VKILFVCHRVPFPPKRGGKIRPFNIIRHLSEQGHRVTVASLARNKLELEESSGLREHCERALIEIISERLAWLRMMAWLPTTRPSSFAYFFSAGLGRRIQAELETRSYDLVFVHCSSVAPYVCNAQGAVKILDYGDMDSQKWREYVQHKSFPLCAGYWLEAVKLERAEMRLARSFDLCTCTTRAELQSLRDLGVAVPTDWFPNGVDSALYTPTDTYDANLIVFVGRMDYYPNQQAVIEFCRSVLPRLRARRPALRFEIVGAEPPQSIRELGFLPGVTVTGSVADVRPYVLRAALTVAPLTIARGTQNKILESMAMGVPVVCSTQASNGVDAVCGEHLLTASSCEEYEEVIGRVLDSASLRAQLAHAARERVLTHHSWSSSMTRLDLLIGDALERRKAARSARAYALQ
jgi:sugar transferase (PEP-CTERM/EpsH1 system associated)